MVGRPPSNERGRLGRGVSVGVVSVNGSCPISSSRASGNAGEQRGMIEIEASDGFAPLNPSYESQGDQSRMGRAQRNPSIRDDSGFSSRPENRLAGSVVFVVLAHAGP